jgi:long-chain acyl-CoA synthetase
MPHPWLASYDAGIPAAIEVPELAVPDLLRRAAAHAPGAAAVVFFGKTTTYGSLLQQVQRLAGGLKALGLAPGDRLAILLPNSPQLVAAYHAVLSLGGVAVMLNPLLSPKEIGHQLRDSGSRFLVVLDHLLPKVEQVEGDLPLEQVVVTGLRDALPWLLSWLYPLKAWRQGLALGFRAAPGRRRWRDLLAVPPLTDLPRISPDDLAVLQYTGGTTGIPKAAVLTHRNLMANVTQINAWLPQVTYGAERVVGLIPFFHIFGLTVCLNWTFSQAALTIVLPKFEIQTFLKILKKYRPTVLPGVPTLFVALINHPELPRIDFSQMWACISGSAPLPVEVRDRFQALTGCRILEGYGLTEASPVTHLNPLQGECRAGSIGLPFPGTWARIMDEDTGTRELPPGKVGELVIKGPQVMREYWHQPQETAQTLRDGWLYTGDLARMDEQGYFYIIDRKKDLIISSGFNVYPREVEEVLYQHPGVQEAVAYGVPDPYRGELVKVAIVPKEGVSLTPDEIIEFCKPRLATYKLPKCVEFRRELPKSMVGKVLRRLLREEEQAARASQTAASGS